MATADFSLSKIPYPFTFHSQKIGLVTAAWNGHITSKLRESAVQTLLELGCREENIVEMQVPGAFELASGAQILFLEKNVEAVICLGCVIKGGTPHFDYVCNAAAHGIMQVGLEMKKPCIFGVLTTNDENQALARAGGEMGNKGSEAALSAVWMMACKQNQ